ncbi:MAG: hypothetical protein JNK82_19900 [Myxococcaceae bacterium]|nr:hypothetical protein [Myxococcaceae bacterium]
MASTFEPRTHVTADPRVRLESSLERSGAPAEVRSRVLARLDRLPEEDAARERALLERVSSGPNASRAVRAYDEVARIAESSATARQRLTPEVREALVRGVADPRTPGDPLGNKGIMGVRQATTAAETLVHMPRDRYDAVSGLLSSAGRSHSAAPSADPSTERALILEAVAARSEELRGRGTAGDRALDQVRGFANDVRGLSREELVRTTSAIDVDSRVSSSTTDPEHLGRTGTDAVGDNDGLVQRFRDSCSPTVAQMERAELDPVHARRLHRDGVSSGATTGDVAAEQRRTLEAHGGRAVSRESHDRAIDAVSRLLNAFDAAHASPEMRSRMVRYARGQVTDTEELMHVRADLETLRSASGGSPSVEDLQVVREESRAPRGRGVDLGVALNRVAGDAANARYVTRNVGAHGLTASQANDLARRIAAGNDVGMRITDAQNHGGHAMLMTDVRGSGADREFLVSDPWSGRSAWVRESELRAPHTPAFEREFGLGWDRMRQFYVPQ